MMNKKELYKKNKHQITITFPSEEIMEDFAGYLSDGGGEYGFLEYDENDLEFDYSRCFPAWGWREGEPKFIDILKIEKEEQ